MTPLYLAAIAGLPVGLFHDPGPTLEAQYGVADGGGTWSNATTVDLAKLLAEYADVKVDWTNAQWMVFSTDEEDCPYCEEVVAP